MLCLAVLPAAQSHDPFLAASPFVEEGSGPKSEVQDLSRDCRLDPKVGPKLGLPYKVHVHPVNRAPYIPLNGILFP